MSDMIELPGALPDDPPLRVALRRSGRVRRLSLRVSHLDGRATLSMPKGAPRRAAERFVADKAQWLREMVARSTVACEVAAGIDLPLEGRPHRLVVGAGRRVVLGDGRIELPSASASSSAGGGTGPAPKAAPNAASALAGALKALARDRLVAASDHHAAKLGRGYGRITLRDTRSRWGSCSSQGNLMYSWRLILAPPEVLDYVAAHEVAHLDQMNHSPAFWAVVADLCPGYEGPRAWLRRNGSSLHAWRFELTG